MRLTFFGTGTSQGVPVIGCECPVCTSTDPRDHRLRCSALLETDTATLLFDAGPDFRMQMLRSHTRAVDAILVSHEHYDHVGGLDDVRGINYVTKQPLAVYADQRVCDTIRRNLGYVFAPNPYPGVPKIDLICHQMKPFGVKGEEVVPLVVMHGRLPIVGYRVGRFAYITDASALPCETIEALRGIDTLVLNALQHTPHASHFSLTESIEVGQRIGARHTYLTHCSHGIGLHAETAASLPEGFTLAHDEMVVEI